MASLESTSAGMMMHKPRIATLAAAAVFAGLTAPLPGYTQQDVAPSAPASSAPMHMPPAAGATTPAGSEAEKSMMSAMEKMSQTMAAVPMTGNADHDFVAMMIPHHQGAIDMARFELANGKDPAMRKLAEAIVSAQENEINEMQAWQKATSGNP